MKSFDVAVIGGGIIGTAAAAFLAEAGRSVVLFERAELAAGASGRNSGAIQHPFDEQLARLHRESLSLYADLAALDLSFRMPAAPAGLLLLAADEAAVAEAAGAIAVAAPALAPEVLTRGEPHLLEPGLAEDLAACRLETAYPVQPAAATYAFAHRAGRAGAEIRTATQATPVMEAGRVTAVGLGSAGRVACHQVLVAAGPWSPEVLSTALTTWAAELPIRPFWGVVVRTTISRPPTHVLEELGIDRPGPPPEALFSLVTAGRESSVGSTFVPRKPDPETDAAAILTRAARFVPTLAGAKAEVVRACARPVSSDGRPLVGAVPGADDLFICAGHGPWGISTGPASSLLISRQMLGLAQERSELSPSRFARSP